MSSPFAQKFMGKRPFSDEQYEALAKKYAKREKEESAETGAPDYELKLKLQKQLAEELAKKKESGDNSPLKGAYASGAGGMSYVSSAPAFQNLQDKISAGIQAGLDLKKAKKKKEQWSKAFNYYKPEQTPSTYNFQSNVGLSDYKESNEQNPFYKGQD